MIHRPRRNRSSQVIRDLVTENNLTTNDFIYPLFLLGGVNQKEEVKSMPGIFRWTLDLMLKEIESCMKLGIHSFVIFPCFPDNVKDKYATLSYDNSNFYLDALFKIKTLFPQSYIMTDVAMDPYSSDGHDGIVENGKILNDETLEVLGKMTLAQAQTGVDAIGPSDMMDGRIGYLRSVLDEKGFTNTSIISYSAKYASAYYGPFRDALDSAPKFGDKKTYQMNPANAKEALLEASLDFEEGADILMVKPALSYLDIIKSLNDNFDVPIAAYNVSGEYAMIKAADEKGWIDGEKVMLETLLSMKRAGASIILSYHAKEFAQLHTK